MPVESSRLEVILEVGDPTLVEDVEKGLLPGLIFKKDSEICAGDVGHKFPENQRIPLNVDLDFASQKGLTRDGLSSGDSQFLVSV